MNGFGFGCLCVCRAMWFMWCSQNDSLKLFYWTIFTEWKLQAIWNNDSPLCSFSGNRAFAIFSDTTNTPNRCKKEGRGILSIVRDILLRWNLLLCSVRDASMVECLFYIYIRASSNILPLSIIAYILPLRPELLYIFIRNCTNTLHRHK